MSELTELVSGSQIEVGDDVFIPGSGWASAVSVTERTDLDGKPYWEVVNEYEVGWASYVFRRVKRGR